MQLTDLVEPDIEGTPLEHVIISNTVLFWVIIWMQGIKL